MNYGKGIAERMEEIYLAQEKPRFYKWVVELNDQLAYLEMRVHKANIDLDIVGIRQNCDNMHLVVEGDSDEIAWMDMALLARGNRMNYKHFLVLEHGNG